MTRGIRLVRVDFDNMENRNARSETAIGVFVDDPDSLSAYGKVARWFEGQPPVKLYTGWDDKVYPQFVLEGVNVE